MSYSSIGHHHIVLIFAIQKLHHYFLVHSLNLVTMSNPVEYILSRPAMSGRISRWLPQPNEFEFTVVIPRGLRTQALSDLLV